METNDISVVIPAYNEESCIENALSTISDYLGKNFVNFEIIVVDDGSRDDTFSIISQAAKKMPNLKVLRNSLNSGKGYSVKRGVLAASFPWILFSDADLSTPIEELGACRKYFNDGVDIVIGSRALKQSRIAKRQKFLRMSMGKTFNFLVQLFLFRGIKDTQCGFKIIRRDVARQLFGSQRLNGFCFDVEILYIAKKKTYIIKEHPVKWVNREDSRVSIVSDPVKMFRDIFSIKLNDLRGFYGD